MVRAAGRGCLLQHHLRLRPTARHVARASTRSKLAPAPTTECAHRAVACPAAAVDSTEVAAGDRQRARALRAQWERSKRRQGLRHAARVLAAAQESTEAGAGDRRRARALRADRERSKRRQGLRHAARVLAAAQESTEAGAGERQQEAARHARDVLLANTTLAAQEPQPGAVSRVLHAPLANTEAVAADRQRARAWRAHRGRTRRRQGLRHAARVLAAVQESTEAAAGEAQQAAARHARAVLLANTTLAA